MSYLQYLSVAVDHNENSLHITATATSGSRLKRLIGNSRKMTGFRRKGRQSQKNKDWTVERLEQRFAAEDAQISVFCERKRRTKWKRNR